MKKPGRLCTAIGLTLLAAAVCLTAYNLRTDTEAGDSAKNLLDQLEAESESAQQAATRSETGCTAETDSSSAVASENTVIPDYVLNPEMNMPEKRSRVSAASAC